MNSLLNPTHELTQCVKHHRLVNPNILNGSKYLHTLDTMRREAELCDVILVAGDVEVRAHKNVLAASSPYFRTMFTNFAESKKDRIVLEKFEGQTLQLLIDILYKAEVFVSEKEVQSLCLAASYLQLNEICDGCCEIIKQQLKTTNCLEILSFAQMFEFTDLKSTANAYLQEHFSDVVKTEDFLELTIDNLLKLIAQDFIIASEEEVFECVTAWVTHSLSEREKFIVDLLENVRLPLLPYDFLYTRAREEPLLKDNRKCMHLLMKALEYKQLSTEQKDLVKVPGFKPRSSKKILLTLGGDESGKNVQWLDFTGERWYQVADMPEERHSFAATEIAGTAYVLGGYMDGIVSASVQSFDLVNKIWSSCKYMNTRRAELSVAVSDNLIYAVGGHDGSSYFRSAEVYDPKMMQWKMIASMTTVRSGAGVAVINGSVYVFGGFNVTATYLSDMECYCSHCDTWTTMADMNYKREFAGTVVMDGLIYVVGGTNFSGKLSSAEVYDPKINKWSPIADMNFCRRGPGLIALNNSLYVIDGDYNTSSVEVYNPQLDTWTILDYSMGEARTCGGMVLIDKANVPNENLLEG